MEQATNMEDKIIMSPDEVKKYHKSNIYFRGCCVCDAVQKIEEGMTDETWTKEVKSKQLMAMGNTVTHTYCPECYIEYNKQIQEFLKTLEEEK